MNNEATNRRLDFDWNGVAVNVITESEETYFRLLNRLFFQGISYTSTRTHRPANDQSGILALILGES
jgi:hypothetical protein